MIKANDVRISNWLLATGSLTKGAYHQITAIESDIIFFGPVAFSLGNCGGILLTEEWLAKLGFEDNLPWEKGAFRLDSENRLMVVDENGYGVIVARGVVHVHRLQNIIFALTEEELTIKEPAC